MTAENNSGRDSLPRAWCLLIFSAVVLFRLLCLLDFADSPFFDPIGGDRALYHNLAGKVFRGEGFPDAIAFMPLYPVLLGLVYKIIGAPNLAAAALFQILLEGLTAILVMRLAFRQHGRPAALAAGGAYVLFGIAAAYSLVTTPVSLGLFWTALVAVVADGWQGRWNYGRAAIMGLLLGCGGLIVAPFWLMVVPFAVWIGLSRFNKVGRGVSLSAIAPLAAAKPLAEPGCATADAEPSERAAHPEGSPYQPETSKSTPFSKPDLILALLLILAAAATSLPSLIHNYRIERRLAPVSVHGGLNFYMGNNPDSSGYGTAVPGLRTSAEEMTADSVKLAGRLSGRSLGAAEASRFWTAKAFAFWREAPARGMILLFKKIQRAVSVRDFDDLGLIRLLPGEVRPLRFGVIGFGVIWICACIGFMFSPSPFRGRAAFWIMGLCVIAGMLVTFVTARYRLPLAILLLPSAAGGVIQFANYFRHILKMIVKLRWRGRDAAALPLTESAIIGRARASGPAAYSKFSSINRFALALAGILLAVLPHPLPDTEAADSMNRAIYYSRAGRPAEALEAAGTAVACDPGSAEAWFVIGNVLAARTNYPAALQAYERSLGIQGGRPDALFNAGFVLEQLGRPKEAGACYRKVVALEPRHAAAWLGLALTSRALGDEKSARQAIERASEIAGRDHPQIAEFYRNQPPAH